MGYGIGGITLSTSLVTLFNACVLGYFITKKMSMNYKSLFVNAFKMIVAGVIALGVCYFTAVQYDNYVVLPKFVFESFKILLVAFICLAVYIPLNLSFKMEYAKELFTHLSAKFQRK